MEPADLPMSTSTAVILLILTAIGMIILMKVVAHNIRKIDPEQLERTKDAPETVHVRQTGSAGAGKGKNAVLYHYFKTDDGRTIKISWKKGMRLHPPVPVTERDYTKHGESGMLTYQGTQLIGYVPD